MGKTLALDAQRPRAVRVTWLTVLAPVAALLVALATFGCSSGDQTGETGPFGDIGDAGEAGSVGCVDHDGDGYGKGCLKGLDCDDTDPATTDQCYRCAHAGIADCPCTDEGARAACGQVESKLGDQVTCGYGESTCTDGKWGPCIINNSATLPGAQPSGAGKSGQNIGGASSVCVSNPCDPYCQSFDNDTPSGITGTNISSSDAGITLGAGSGTPVDGSCTGGTFGSCSHSICSTGSSLLPGCDNNAVSCGVPTTWPQKDPGEAVNDKETTERYGTYVPSFPSVDAPQQVDAAATSARYATYTPAFPQKPADEPVDAVASAGRFSTYSVSFPSAPAADTVNAAATSVRYGLSAPTWASTPPDEIVNSAATGAGTSYYNPTFPSTTANEPALANPPYSDANVPYPAVAATEPVKGTRYQYQNAPPYSAVTPTDGTNLGANYGTIPFGAPPGPSEVQNGSSNYTTPTGNTVAPTGGTVTGSACGGPGTSHVAACGARPDAPASTTDSWTGNIDYVWVDSRTVNVAAGTFVDVKLSRVQSWSFPWLVVKVNGNVQTAVSGTASSGGDADPKNESNASITLPGARYLPTVLPVFAGPTNITGGPTGTSNSISNFDCGPVPTSYQDQYCRFYFATAGSLVIGGYDYAWNGGDFTVTVTKTPKTMYPVAGSTKVISNQPVPAGVGQWIKIGTPGTCSNGQGTLVPMPATTPATNFNSRFSVTPGSTVVVTKRYRSGNTLATNRTQLYVKLNNDVRIDPLTSSPYTTPLCYFTDTGRTTETCVLTVPTSGNPAGGPYFTMALYNPSGATEYVDIDFAEFRPQGACPAGSLLDSSTPPSATDTSNMCCACAGGESPGNGTAGNCATNECGKSCPAGSQQCNGNQCCTPQTCPAGYKLSGGTCVWDGTSCTGAVCSTGSCQMVGGAPKCVVGCTGGTSHVCGGDASKCCDWTCPTDYNVVNSGGTYLCQPITSSCTNLAKNTCTAAGATCITVSGAAYCQKSCQAMYGGSTKNPHVCGGGLACCEYQCNDPMGAPNDYTYVATAPSNGPTMGTCAPQTAACTAHATALCGGVCQVVGGVAKCGTLGTCTSMYTGSQVHTCSGDSNSCCEWICDAAHPNDYTYNGSACVAQTAACTPYAQSLCGGASCVVSGGKAQCRTAKACTAQNPANPNAHVCSSDASKCCDWTCSAPYNYLNTAITPKPACERHDCSLAGVCGAGDVCEGTGAQSTPNERCRHFGGVCSAPYHICSTDPTKCCEPYSCPPSASPTFTYLNTSTNRCERRDCAAPGACNPGDTCLQTGAQAYPNQMCQHDNGCGSGTHACNGTQCCDYTCPPGGDLKKTVLNGNTCEQRDCSLCNAGDTCVNGTDATAGCKHDNGCSINGTHACNGTQCCGYKCPPASDPSYNVAAGNKCELRTCAACAAGDACLGSPPSIQCQHDNGCPAGTSDCNGGQCCKPGCAPAPLPGYDVYVKDPIYGDRCENHDCSLCGIDTCAGATADAGCKHDFGCDNGTFACSSDGTKCCDATCPPPSAPTYTVKNGNKCEAHDCSACALGATCAGTAPNIQCCGATTGCVAGVCALHPECCAGTWGPSCVTWAKSICNVDCVGIGSGGTCAVCFHDNVDHDGDGYSSQDGDCMDCYGGNGVTADFINPGAFDIPNNGVDDDCSGGIDDDVVDCGAGLPLASSNAFDYAKAMDLCKINPPAKQWGVTSAKVVQANGTSTPGSYSYGILPNLGAQLTPQGGSNMAVFSTGTARRPGDSNFVHPKQYWNCGGSFGSCSKGSKDWGVTAAYPKGYPRNKAGCPNPSGSANDSSGLIMTVRVPTNAKSFSYNLDYYSSEYPEWVCSSYNDSFVALLTSNHPTNVANAGAPNWKNISFDSNGSPINVNNNFFTVTNQAVLAGSGFDGTNCWDPYISGKKVICGAATGWLQTTAPVTPGETITLQFAIWDTSDHIYDSTVLVDNFKWSAKDQPISTSPDPGPSFVTDGDFIRDYDASLLCAGKPGTSPRWGRWNWTAQTPDTSMIEFYVSTADTAAGLNTATEKALVFDNLSGWPAAMQDKMCIAKTASTAPAYAATSSSGSTVVDYSLQKQGLPTSKPFVRIRSHLKASTPTFAFAPTLQTWSLEVDCVPDQ